MWAAFAPAAAGGFALASIVDRPVQVWVVGNEDVILKWVNVEFYWVCRSLGYLPTWLLAAAMALVQGRDGWRRAWRGGLVAATAVAAGLASEGMKLLIRRARPPLEAAWDGHHVWRAWTDRPFSTSDLGLPSGHATIGFAGMLLLCRIYPRAWAIWLPLAVGCAASRVVNRGHFVSDVWASVVLAHGIVWCVWRLHRRRERRVLAGAPAEG